MAIKIDCFTSFAMTRCVSCVALTHWSLSALSGMCIFDVGNKKALVARCNGGFAEEREIGVELRYYDGLIWLCNDKSVSYPR